MPNPFYVDPLGGQGGQIANRLSGIGQILGQKRQAQEQQARQQQATQEIQQAIRSGDPMAVADVSAKYPELSKFAQDQFGFINDQTKQAARKGFANVLATDNPVEAASYLEETAAEMEMLGADPVKTRLDAEALRMGDENVLQQVKMGAMIADPTLRDAYQSMQDQQVDRAQFGATDMVKDSEGNLFYVSQMRSPNTREVKTVYSSIGAGPDQPKGRVQIAGQYGQTAQEKLRQSQSAATVSERGKIEEKSRQQFIDSGLKARPMIGKTMKMIELNDAISTGKIAKAQKLMSDTFGVTDADVGQFNALAGNLILDNIRMLGANPTEGERAFLERITPSLEQGGAVNKAVLQDMLEVQRRQVERAKWFAKNKDKTVSDYLLEVGDFQDAGTQRESIEIKAGDIQDGYLFKGGDPADPNNWEAQ